MAQLTSEIKDLHAFYAIHPIDSVFGQYQIGINVEYVHPDFIITAILDSSKFKFLPVKIGDKIIEINNVPVNEYADSLIQYISGSRLEIKYVELQRYLLFGKFGSPLLIKTNRDTFTSICTMRRFSKEYMKHSPIAPAFMNLNDSIVYINYGDVRSQRQMKKYFNVASKLNKDILIDMTQVYHGNTHPVFSKFTHENSCIYAQVKYPDENTLGHLKLEEWKLNRNRQTLSSIHAQELKRKIYVLINGNTRSHGEYVAQIIIHCLGGIPIGRPTAGCDGDIRFIKLPYDFWTGFSGIGIYGPDMQQYQINGIQPVKYIPAQLEEFIGDHAVFLNKVVNNFIYKKE
jgi:C-terminal processing protease CtpA/Prc